MNDHFGGSGNKFSIHIHRTDTEGFQTVRWQYIRNGSNQFHRFVADGYGLFSATGFAVDIGYISIDGIVKYRFKLLVNLQIGDGGKFNIEFAVFICFNFSMCYLHRLGRRLPPTP